MARLIGAKETRFEISGNGGVKDIMLSLVEFDWNARKREFQVQVQRDGAPETVGTYVVKSDYLYCDKRTQPISLDGKLDDWPKSPNMRLANNDIPGLKLDRRQGPEDCSCNAWMSWDDGNLYFAFQVKDNAVVQSHKLQVYREYLTDFQRRLVAKDQA